MNRRGFLKLIALAPAVAAVPSLAMGTVKRAARESMMDSMAFIYRPDINKWMGYAVTGDVVKYGQQWEFCMMFDEEPDDARKKMFAEMAEHGFERAKWKGK